ncbi:DUF2637 domain-containing protein [Streptomyces marispadix]|uniref:DUF2637 domain-containing protein n=1 Tax=Streptomyces marispadix TaxID=2922868 RepID=A0ABS9T408_9ACTN|nr:DUF2637 domain-containing protein [Streptomyces marispadix]MCH6163260.1 DUF2637 domain-containing protein [Streptomyces marispadix]
MTLTDLPLGGAAAGVALLAVAVAAVVLVVRGRRARRRAREADGAGGSGRGSGGFGGSGGDSWEQLEQRRRRKETFYATAAYLLLFCCAAVAAALSFHGLVGFGRQNLRLSGGWEYLVPFGLDGAAMFSAVIAVREASHGDASLGSRLLVWAFASAAAWFNWVHAPRGDAHAGAPEFFAGMSLSAAILFDRALKQTRRAALREQGLVPRPLPQIRVVRWLRAPRETFRAWSLMLLEGVRTLDQAVDEVREERREHEQERLRRKEQQKLDLARAKAMGKQLRGKQSRRQLRGSGRRGAGVDGGTAATLGEVGEPGGAGGAGAAGGVGGARPGPGADVSAAGAVAGPAPGSAVAGGRGEDSGAGAGAAAGTGGAGASTAGPRLDSLEEKLAEIERQFG